MPRPTPIIIPGQGFSSKRQQTDVSVDIGPVLKYFKDKSENDAFNNVFGPVAEKYGLTQEQFSTLPLDMKKRYAAALADVGIQSTLERQKTEVGAENAAEAYRRFGGTERQVPAQGTPASFTVGTGTGTQGNFLQQALMGNRLDFNLGNINAQMPSPDYQAAHKEMVSPTDEQISAFKALFRTNPKGAQEFLDRKINPQEKNLESILAERVKNGEMTIEDALQVKQTGKAPNDFGVFYNSQKAEGKTDAEISKAWHKQKVEEQKSVAEIRIPSFMQGRDLPPDVMVDRKTGKLVKYNAESGKVEPYKPEGSVAEAGATYKADKASLANIVKGKDTINAFEKGVSQSLGLIDKLSTDMTRGRIPGVNKLSQFAQYQGGNPDIKAFKNALTTAMTEYMKVTTAGTGISAAELTQGAQQRAKELLEISDNPETFKKSLNIIRQEMSFKKNAFDAQEKEIKGRLGDKSKAGTEDPLGLR